MTKNNTSFAIMMTKAAAIPPGVNAAFLMT